jgi:hypothetical protein
VGGHQLSGSVLLQLHSACSLCGRSRGLGFERKEGSLGATLRLAPLAPALGPKLVGDHASENSVFLDFCAAFSILIITSPRNLQMRWGWMRWKTILLIFLTMYSMLNETL